MQTAPTVTPAAAQRAFIAQSVRSDYCGVYAAAMFLSLHGMSTTRAQAKRLFGVAQAPGPEWTGATRRQIAQVLGERLPASASWRTLEWGDISAGLDDTRMTLIVARARYRETAIRARHSAVAVGVHRGELRLLDPLGRPPARGRNYNVSVALDGARMRKAQGSCWYADTSVPLFVLGAK